MSNRAVSRYSESYNLKELPNTGSSSEYGGVTSFGTYRHVGSIMMIYAVGHELKKTLDRLKLGTVYQEGPIDA